MSKARNKGTAGENEIVTLLHDCGQVGAHRAEAGKESHDIRGVGDWVLEVKYRKRWELFKWVRKVRKVAGDAPWAIFAIHGDRRTVEGAAVGRVMVVDASFGAELLNHWEQWNGRPNLPRRAHDWDIARVAGAYVEMCVYCGEVRADVGHLSAPWDTYCQPQETS